VELARTFEVVKGCAVIDGISINVDYNVKLRGVE